MTEPMEKIREAFLKRMKKEKLTQRDVHRASGVDVAVLSRFFSGQQGLSVKNFVLVCAALDLSVEDMVALEPDWDSEPAVRGELERMTDG